MLNLPRLLENARATTRATAAVICAGLLSAPSLVAAQSSAQSEGAAPAPAASGANRAAREAIEQRLRGQLAQNITRIALMDLRAVPSNEESPTFADYDAARILLGFAHDLAPTDEEILRRYIEAAYSAGDESLVLELTRRLLAADIAPHDTVAQLRLISASVSRRNQTAEERLARYEEFLGPRGRSFDAAIRSRLALDAALLLRERGDNRGFLEKLTLSTQLDPTHKEAASLAATIIAESGQGPRATFEGLSLLLMADPMDPNVHLTIARFLASSHAFEAARRFHGNAVGIMQVAGNMPDAVYTEARVLQWHVEGPLAVLKQINRELVQAQDAAARDLRRAQDSQQRTEGMRRPEEIRLPLHMAALAAIAAQSAEDDNAAEAVLHEMTTEAARIVQVVEDAIRRGEVDEQQAAATVVSSVLQVQSARLWTNLQIDRVERDLETNREVFKQVSADALRILDGWLAVRQGRAEEGLAALQAYAELDRLALIGVGVAYEALNQPDRAEEVYIRSLNEAPLEITGAWARTRLLAMGHKIDRGQTAALERLARTIPAQIDQMVANPRAFVQLSARALNLSPQALDRQVVRITIRNVSEFPLALGADRAINSRMLVSPKLELDGRPAEQLIRPEVIDLDRRLRLMPRETLEVDIWPDPGSSGWIMDMLANRNIRTRWRIVQGFVLDRDVGFRPGPMSQACETGAIVRGPLPEASLPSDVFAMRVAGSPPSDLPRLAAAVRARLLQPMFAPTGRDTAEDMQAMVPAIEVFTQRYPHLSATERASLVTILPHAAMSPFLAPFDDVARADTDPLVMAVFLATRISSPDDAYLSRAAESGDERLAALAEALKARLAGDTQFYSRINFSGETPNPADGAR